MSDIRIERDPSALIALDVWFPAVGIDKFTVPGGATIFLANSHEINIDKAGVESVEGIDYISNDQLAVEVHPDDVGTVALVEADMAEPDNDTKRTAEYAQNLLQAVFDECDIKIIHIKSGIRKDQTKQGEVRVPYRMYGYV